MGCNDGSAAARQDDNGA